MIGREVLGYCVEECIGRGSFASVYKVKKENESGTYIKALKHIVIPEQAQYQRVWNAMGRDDEKTNQYFEKVFQSTMQEIQLMYSFTESGVRNIVACYENDVIRREQPRRYEIFILMEYLTALPDYLSQNELTAGDVLNIGIQVLDALMFCHHQHIIHRDIKEENIFITADGICKLGDFGVAKVLRENDLAHSMKGTAEYMAPEIYKKTGEYDETVDLYSLGMVMYRLMNHMRAPFMPAYPKPFDACDENHAFIKRMDGKPLPPADSAPEMLDRCIRKALASRNMRYQDAESFKKDLMQVKSRLSEQELMRSVMTGKVCSTMHIAGSQMDSEEKERTNISKKRSRKRNITAFVLTSLILIICLSVYGVGRYRQQASHYVKWQQESIFPYDCIAMEMTEADFRALYGDRFSGGLNGKYYLQVEYQGKMNYATIIFDESYPQSISYSFDADESEWKNSIQNFYADWQHMGEGWPYVAEKGKIRAVLDYDLTSQRASLFINYK